MASFWRQGDITGQGGFGRFRQQISFTLELQSQTGKNLILVSAPVFELQLVRCGLAEPADQA